jgi:hypothetical protein
VFGAKLTCRDIGQLNDDMQAAVPDGTTVGLRLSSPVARFRKTKAQLAATIQKMMTDDVPDGTELELVINGNDILLWVTRHGDPQYKKVSAVISNRHSDPNILLNATNILEERIKTKTEKCRDVRTRPLWLGLFNDYWLADEDTYRLAMSRITAPHFFEKILIISGMAR